MPSKSSTGDIALGNSRFGTDYRFILQKVLPGFAFR